MYRSAAHVDVFTLPEHFTYVGSSTYTTAVVYCFVYEYATDESNSYTYLRRKQISQGNIYTRSSDCKYVRFTVGFTSSSGVTITSGIANNLFKIGALKDCWQMDILRQHTSWRVANLLARARQMASIGYTPLATIPCKPSDMSPSNYYHGVPYSSVRALDTFIGHNVSLHTFATMLKNRKSVIYKRKSTNSNSKTYVGIVCSSFVDYCLGIDFPITITMMEASDDFVERDFWNFDVGDAMLNGQHGILIVKVERDEYGRPVTIGVVQAAPPRVSYSEYSAADLKTFIEANGYTIYSYVGTSDVPYEACQYVKGYPDETLDLTYPDIMSEYGDKAVINAGTDVTINVINAGSYTAINVYKDGTLVDTKTDIEDFTLENVAYGTWKVELTDGETTSSSEFIAVDVSGISYDYETKIVTFSSANSTPIGISTYGADGGMAALYRLTDSDVERGTYDMTGKVDTGHVRVALKTDWGQTAWRSYATDFWTAYSG